VSLSIPIGKWHGDYDRAKRVEQIVCSQYCDDDTDAADLAAGIIASNPELTDNEIARRVAQLILQP
jgi:hypothetical protein